MAEEMEYTDEKIQEPEAQPAQEPVLEEQPKPEEPEEKAEPVKETDQPKASQERPGKTGSRSRADVCTLGTRKTISTGMRRSSPSWREKIC